MTQLLEMPAPPAERPERAERPGDGGMSVATSFGLLAAGIVAFFLATTQVHPEKVGDFGLVAEAGPVYWLAILFVSAVFTVNLVRTPHRSLVLAASIVTLLFMIYGLGSVTETAPRFQVAWLHAGFIEYISRTHAVLPSLDARFSWPGAFSFGAFADAIAGVPSAVTLIRWAPLVFGVLYLAPLYSIAASLTTDVRVRWLTLWIFAIGNWVGQDYLSPQAAAYVLFLVILMILLRWFRPQVPGYKSRQDPSERRRARLVEFVLRLSRAPNEVDFVPPSPALRGALSAIVIALFAALVVSHQLTPVFLIGLIMVLVITRRLDVGFIPLIFILLFLGWVSWGAIAFWQGHLSNIIGGFGSTGSNVQQNVGTHFATKNTGREVILFTRVAMTGALMLLAGAGVLLRRSLRHVDLTVILGMLAPFPVVLVQAYGGEALLRAYICALPFIALLVAHGLVSGPLRAALRQSKNPARRERAARQAAIRAQRAVRYRMSFDPFVLTLWLMISLVSVVGVASSVAVRYGNERFEEVRGDDLRAVNEFYKLAHTGDTLLTPNSNLPIYKNIASYDFVSGDDAAPPIDLKGMDKLVNTARGRTIFVVFAPGEAAYGETFLSLLPGWMNKVEAEVAAAPNFHLVYKHGSAIIYTATKLKKT